MINELYLKPSYSYNIDYFNLCRVLHPNKYEINFDTIENITEDISTEIKNFIAMIENKIILHLQDKKVLESFELLQIVETSQCIIKYVFCKQIEAFSYFNLNKDIIFKFMSLLLIVLESIIGIHYADLTNIHENSSERDKFLEFITHDTSIQLNVDINSIESPYVNLHEIKKYRITEVLTDIFKHIKSKDCKDESIKKPNNNTNSMLLYRNIKSDKNKAISVSYN